MTAAAVPRNALTVDVEDWPQSVFDNDLPISDRFVANTERVMALLAEHGVRATFFVLGKAAEHAPGLVRAIVGGGHELASHGYGHRLVTRQTPGAFRADVRRARGLLEDIAGVPVSAYRAPAFSITSATAWALDVLVETGHTVDSSIFPRRMPRYGVTGLPAGPCRLRTPGGGTLLEAPVATLRVGGVRLPAGGGGYLRLLPAIVARRAVRQANRAGRPAVIYLHPYEFAPGELGELDLPIPWRLRWHQELGRRHVPGRVATLLRAAPFGTLAEALADTTDLPSVSLTAGGRARRPLPAAV